jgi:flagellar hook-associated protein 2
MAGTFTVSGLGSNIDFSVITDSIINARSAPITLMSNQQSVLKGRSDALKQLNTKLLALKDAATALNDQTLGTGRAASTSDSSVVTASAASTAANGSVNLQVTRLAQGLVQTSNSFNSDQSPVLADGATSATFKIYKGGVATDTEITVDTTANNNNTLAGLRDAINNANAGVTAAIVDVNGDGTGNQLVLSSTGTGAAGRVELVETTGTGTDTKLGLRSLNSSSGDFSDLDSQIKVNGLTINRSTNSVSDVVKGVTFTLKNTGTSSVTVANDSGSFKSKIAAFVDAYNSVQDFINTQYQADASGKPTGVLAQDSTLRGVQSDLRSLASTASTTNGGALSGLAQIGITRGDDGKLTVDQSVLNDKLNNSLSDVRALFAGAADGSGGLAGSLADASAGISTNVQAGITGFDDSVTRLADNIANQQTRLAALRESLTRQFSVADAAIGQLNGQNTALTNILKSLQSSSDSKS